MTNDQNFNTASLLRDSTIIIAVFTAFAFFLGFFYFFFYNHFLGLSQITFPDYSIEEILLTGGLIIAAEAILFAFVHLILWKIINILNHKKILVVWARFSTLSNIEKLKIVVITTIGVIMFSMSICVVLAQHQTSRPYTWQKVESIYLISDNTLSNPTELAFLGNRNSYLIFKRIEGLNTGEIELISKDNVKRLTLKRKTQ